MIAILDAYRAGLFKRNYWMQNILAGAIVGVIALPLAMAFAIASGVKPEQGIYTAIIAAFLIAVFGGSRAQIGGPTGAFVVILASITAKYGISGLQIATIMAGLILLFMGYLKLGNVIKFIPDPVVVGFTAGIGVIIFIGEWKDFFGLPTQFALDAHLHQKLIALVNAFPNADLTTTLLGLGSLALVLITPRIVKRIPGPLVALVVMTTIQSMYQFKSVATLGSAFGGIPQQLPHFQLPSTDFAQLLELIGPAFTIALLGAIESLLSATAADAMAGTSHQSNQELIGQGIANIVTPFFGGFAATGAIARTASNIRNGGNSPLAAITHSAFLMIVLLLLAPLAAHVPLCTLAAILFVVAFNMSDVPHFIRVVTAAPRYDVIVLLITFFLTVFTNLVLAVNVGVIFAMFFFIHRMHQIVSIEEQSHHEGLQKELTQLGIALPSGDTMIYNIQGPFFFGVAEKIEHALAIAHTDPKQIIFRLKEVPFMDMTGLDTLEEILEQYQKRGVSAYLCEANSRIRRKLKDANILRFATSNKVYDTLYEVLRELETKAT
ncbi:MAG: sodium-independent anion transporter [Gammaproteobacteria bacterium RIFCSPHIGHO2_12_FULL_42_13]|nr:MAG: sodium-independent anion transporter [Gammaproteobacteria bacterium RIFCSPHIGHO2_12_FULL_42_13]